MTQRSTWHGTESELRQLRAAVDGNCTCKTNLLGRRDGSCGPHAMLVDERVLDHLLYVYRARDKFRRAERSAEFGAYADLSSSALAGDLASETIARRAWRQQMYFRDRSHAGRQLAAQLAAYANREDVLVLGLPRGGVPVAYEVAAALRAPLDVFLVRKLGAPGHRTAQTPARRRTPMPEAAAIAPRLIETVRHAAHPLTDAAAARDG